MMIANGTSVKGPAPRQPSKEKKEDKTEAGTGTFFDSLNQAYGQMAAAVSVQAPQAEAGKASQGKTAGQVQSMPLGLLAQKITAITGSADLAAKVSGRLLTAAAMPGGQALKADGPKMEAGSANTAAGSTNAAAVSANAAAGSLSAAAVSVAAAEKQPTVGLEQPFLLRGGDKVVKTFANAEQGAHKLDVPGDASVKGLKMEIPVKQGASVKQEAEGKQGETAADQHSFVKTADLKAERKEGGKNTASESPLYLQKEAAPAAAGDHPVVKIKVAEPYHQVNQEFSEKLSNSLSHQLQAGNRQYEIRLEPEHLGSVEVKISVSEGNAVVELSCASHKTAELLSQNARTIGALMGQHTQSQVSVQVRQNEEPQWHEGQNGQNHGQERGQQEHPHGRHEEQSESDDFGEQLRLGLLKVV